jgi:hypothetical protein
VNRNDVLGIMRDHTKVRSGDQVLCVCGQLGPVSGVEHLEHVATAIADAATARRHAEVLARAEAAAPGQPARLLIAAGDIDDTHRGLVVSVPTDDGPDLHGVLMGSDRLVSSSGASVYVTLEVWPSGQLGQATAISVGDGTWVGVYL